MYRIPVSHSFANFPLFVLYVLLSAVPVQHLTAQTDTTWIGGPGLWNNPANWSNGIPNGDFNVFIDSGNATSSLVDIPASTGFTVDSVTINALDAIGVMNNATLTIQSDPGRPDSGMILNEGEIIVANIGSTTEINIDQDVVLSGSGFITLQGTSTNSLLTDLAGSDGHLMNVGNTIRGTGQIGVNSMRFTNLEGGTVDADLLGLTLNLDPPNTGGFVNMGMMRASGGGTLALAAGEYDNTDGIIIAEAGSQVLLNTGSSVTGGELQSSGDGSFVIPTSNVASIDNLTLTNGSQLNQLNNAELNISGNLNNNGSINVTNAGSTTDIRVDSILSLQGGGILTLSGSSDFSRVLDPLNSDGVLTNVDNTIQGRGNIGVNTLQVVNQSMGLIDANSPAGTLIVDPRTDDPMINMGTIRASGGGTLALAAGDYDNTDGIIIAEAGSQVLLNTGSSVTGGELQSSGDGSFVIPTSNVASIDNLTLTNGSQLNQLNNAELNISGNLNNNGSINVTNAGSTTDIRVDSILSLQGGGILTLSGSSDASRILDPANTDGVLTNVDNTIQGRGNIGTNSLQVVNQSMGLIDANSTTGALFLDPRAADPMINMGTMQASGGGTLALAGGDYDNTDGIILAEAGSQVLLNTGASVTGGELQSSGDGAIVVPGSNIASVANLTLTNGSQMNQFNNAELNISGTLNNNGSIAVTNVGSTTDILVDGDPVIINGTGSLILTGSTSLSRIVPIGDASLVMMGQTLVGIGQINTEFELVNSTISPGNSIGTLTFGAPAAINGNSSFDIELDAANGTPGTNWDLINSSSTIDLQQSGTDEFTIRLNTLNGKSEPGPIDDFDPGQDYAFTIAIADSIENFNAGDFVFDLSGFANSFTGQFSIARGPFGGGERLVVKYGQFKLGDINQDGAVNLLDVGPFVEAIGGGNSVAEADINCDGQVSLLDVQPFVALLSGG